MNFTVVMSSGMILFSSCLLLIYITYFVFLEFIKPKLIKLGVWLIMNHMDALDTESVEKKEKHLRVKFVYMGTLYTSIIPLGKLGKRNRKMHIQEGEELVEITCVRGAKYKFTPNEIGVDKVVVTETKMGENVMITTFEGDQSVSIL